jgi:diguanylate cyclase (GGDEF)-like protein
VAMPETVLEQAREVARRLRSSMQATNLGARSTQSVEVSIGVAAWRKGMDWQALVQAADAALYEDKRHRKEVRRWGGAEKRPSIKLSGGGSRRRLAGN